MDGQMDKRMNQSIKQPNDCSMDQLIDHQSLNTLVTLLPPFLTLPYLQGGQVVTPAQR